MSSPKKSGKRAKGTAANAVRYYYAGTTRLAMRRGSGSVTWLLGDHLGSTSVSYDGTSELHQGYKPWGETRFGGVQTPYQFTGQYRQASLGLDFFNARWYDSGLGRFVQADTVIPGNQGVQALDRYAYVNNSPANYVDLTGHDWEQIIFNRTGAVPRSMWNPLPEPKDIPTGVNFPPKHPEYQGTQEDYELAIKKKTLEYYEKYREWLLKNGYGRYLDEHGWIRDQVLIALVIKSEFGNLKNVPDADGFYDAALSGLSFQFEYNAYFFGGPPICGKFCADVTAQLTWLQAFQGMREPNAFSDISKGIAWTELIPDALRVMDGWFGGYHSWGEGPGYPCAPLPYQDTCAR